MRQRPVAAGLRRRARHAQRDQEAGQRQQQDQQSSRFIAAPPSRCPSRQSPAPSRTAPRWRSCGCCPIAAAAARRRHSARARRCRSPMPSIRPASTPSRAPRASRPPAGSPPRRRRSHPRSTCCRPACRGRLKLAASESAIPGLATYISQASQMPIRPAATEMAISVDIFGRFERREDACPEIRES